MALTLPLRLLTHLWQMCQMVALPLGCLQLLHGQLHLVVDYQTHLELGHQRSSSVPRHQQDHADLLDLSVLAILHVQLLDLIQLVSRLGLY